MTKSLKEITIGELSSQTGCKVETIRFYEKIGLLEAPARTSGNQRRYNTACLQRLHFIRHARDMGFDIDDIRELINLSEQPSQDCAIVDGIAQRYLESVKERIKKLKKLEKELSHIVTSCKHGTISECRIIETLADHAKCKSKVH
ncbi:MAG: MerR family transcriptional regulator [Alphaproteobacteria bacterium]|nr:MAG: MerR family transcriptional regulator [Alphaproteobacteria bacterium]